jgi:hypothetical protein
LKIGAFDSTRDLFIRVDDKKLVKNRHLHDQLHLLAAILAHWWHPVASIKALDLLHQAMRAVTYQRIAAAIKMASKVGLFVDCCLFACCAGGRWSNTEQVVAQWQHPVDSVVALDMPHWAMPSVLLQQTAVATKNGQQCRCIRFLPPLFLLSIIVAKDHVMVH